MLQAFWDGNMYNGEEDPIDMTGRGVPYRE